MADRTGITYEQLTDRLMREIEQADGVETLEIAQRKIVRGRTTRHEIDVWWVFNWQGQRFTVAFQCKDWARAVDQGELLKFHAALGDLAEHDPSGVFVTRTGYQSGSLSVAAGNRISVLELRKPADPDWAGRVRTVNIALRVCVPTWRAFQLQVPPGTADPGMGSLGGSTADLVVHQSGEPAQTILKIQERLSPAGFEATDWQRMSVDFSPGAWLGSTEDPGLRLPATGLSVEVRRDVRESKITIEGSHVVTHVLKNVLTGTVVAFGVDGKPRQGGAGLAALDLRPHNEP